jgi:3-phosphoshikimate 1-carboxyvinyltransferase
MLLHFGAPVSSRAGSVSVRGPVTLDAAEVYVPGDISSAAFFLVGAVGAPKSSLRLQEVGVNPTRTGILEVLARMGAKIQREGEREASGEPIADLLASTAGALSGTTIGGAEIPTLIDEIPILALAAARASGETRITGAAELKVKESDRIAGTAEVLRAFGVTVEETADGLVIQGDAVFRAAKVASKGDHRLAMTASIAACFAKGESTIDDIGCVETSFPTFFEDLQNMTEKI